MVAGTLILLWENDITFLFGIFCLLELWIMLHFLVSVKHFLFMKLFGAKLTSELWLSVDIHVSLQ